MSVDASVNERGAILLGKHVACDSYDDKRPVRVVTHVHSDHTEGLQQSLCNCQEVVMTAATRDLLEAMQGPLFLMTGNVKTLAYGEKHQLDGETLTLHRADHIIGAAQVSVEDKVGRRYVYTGDFRLSDTPILDADVLVIESTYGNPFQVRRFGRVVESAFIDLVETGLERGRPVYVFGYHGKLQELMQILHNNKVEAPFIVPEKVFHVSKVCEKHGMHFGKVLLSSEDEGKAILDHKEPCVAFYHMNSRRYIARNSFRISVSGWEFSCPRRQISDNEHIVALSDHADFNGLIHYVRESKPKLVITDNYRVGGAKALAREIEKRLGIPAKALPA